jgi:hypothetical protein
MVDCQNVQVYGVSGDMVMWDVGGIGEWGMGNMYSISILIGILLVGIGIVVIWFGDRQVGSKGNLVLNLFSQSSLNVKILKWVMGLLAILFGLSFIIS